ncbi:MAG TPA: hypothetical protein VMT19_11225 [Thermoanaerobaculaceae bacterium]|nr:hypothetical protein [Thermoanaerobaculaceae bacterium]
MNKLAGRLLYWTPRVLCIAFAAFTSIFALDVFQKGVPVWQVALALLMHLLPSTILVIALLVASWRHEWIGGIAFLVLAVLYVVWAHGKPFFGWQTFLLIPGPLVVVGVLFLLNWRYRAQLRPAS